MTEPAAHLPAGVSRAEALVLLQLLLERIEIRLARQERLATPGQRPALGRFRFHLSEVAARFRALLAQLDGGPQHQLEARQVLLLKAGLTAEPRTVPAPAWFRSGRQWSREQAGLENDLQQLARLARQATERFPDGDLQGEFEGCITLARLAHAPEPASRPAST